MRYQLFEITEVECKENSKIQNECRFLYIRRYFEISVIEISIVSCILESLQVKRHHPWPLKKQKLHGQTFEGQDSERNTES